MPDLEKLLQAKPPFLTDGGFETWLFYQQGFEAPEFAALVLMDDESARQAMRRYFKAFLAMAETADTGFVLDTNTWRGCTTWAPRLNRSVPDLLRLSREAVSFANELRDAWRSRVSTIILNGVVGPAGDGYAPHSLPQPIEARNMHRPQIEVLADAGVDMVSALTMTNTGEAIGIVQAASEVGLPAVVSFTVETDGRLPSGPSLAEAIYRVDAETGAAPIYYMINCAHPDHFSGAIEAGSTWTARIGGVRANASRLSHAELDAAAELDDGDPAEFGRLYAGLMRRLPGLRVVGGCCGTDHRHVTCVSRHVHAKSTA